MIPVIGFALACDFSDHSLLKARLTAVEHVTIANENFTGTGVEMTGTMPLIVHGELAQLVTDLTRGKTVIKFDDESI